ncbi:hypothetical protein AUP68_03271 [Ilyonectria robusta]
MATRARVAFIVIRTKKCTRSHTHLADFFRYVEQRRAASSIHNYPQEQRYHDMAYILHSLHPSRPTLWAIASDVATSAADSPTHPSSLEVNRQAISVPSSRDLKPIPRDSRVRTRKSPNSEDSDYPSSLQPAETGDEGCDSEG